MVKKHEELGMDPETFTELTKVGNELTSVPAVERNFGDDSDAEFNKAVEVILPNITHKLLGETAIQAHIRLQSQAFGDKE